MHLATWPARLSVPVANFAQQAFDVEQLRRDLLVFQRRNLGSLQGQGLLAGGGDVRVAPAALDRAANVDNGRARTPWVTIQLGWEFCVWVCGNRVLCSKALVGISPRESMSCAMMLRGTVELEAESLQDIFTGPPFFFVNVSLTIDENFTRSRLDGVRHGVESKWLSVEQNIRLNAVLSALLYHL